VTPSHAHVALTGSPGPPADGNNTYWTNVLTPGVVITIIVVVGVLILAAGMAAYVAYRRIRRDPRWRRRLLTMQAQYSAPGLHRDVIQLQLRLADAVSGARRAVDLANASGSPTGDLGSSVRRLERLAAGLEAQLRLLGDERDDAALTTLLPPIRDRVNDVVAVASRIRQGALETMNGITAPELRQVVTDVDTQVRALQGAMRDLHDLMFDDTARLQSRTPRA
jgi:hypothetical protein